MVARRRVIGLQLFYGSRKNEDEDHTFLKGPDGDAGFYEPPYGWRVISVNPDGEGAAFVVIEKY